MRVITTSAEIHLIVKWICCQIDLFKCLIFVLQIWSWICLFFLLRLSQGSIISFPPCCRCSPSTDLISGRQPLGSSSGSWEKKLLLLLHLRIPRTTFSLLREGLGPEGTETLEHKDCHRTCQFAQLRQFPHCKDFEGTLAELFPLCKEIRP